MVIHPSLSEQISASRLHDDAATAERVRLVRQARRKPEPRRSTRGAAPAPAPDACCA